MPSALPRRTETLTAPWSDSYLFPTRRGATCEFSVSLKLPWPYCRNRKRFVQGSVGKYNESAKTTRKTKRKTDSHV